MKVETETKKGGGSGIRFSGLESGVRLTRTTKERIGDTGE